jgi:hypothetical protein
VSPAFPIVGEEFFILFASGGQEPNVPAPRVSDANPLEGPQFRLNRNAALLNMSAFRLLARSFLFYSPPAGRNLTFLHLV